MPDGYRLWRTADGDLVPDDHPDAELLAYGTGDPLKPEDTDMVRSIEIEGVLVDDDEPLAGTGDAVNADTGEVTQPGDPLPVIEQTDGDPLDAEPEPEKVVEATMPKPAPQPRKRKA